MRKGLLGYGWVKFSAQILNIKDHIWQHVALDNEMKSYVAINTVVAKSDVHMA